MRNDVMMLMMIKYYHARSGCRCQHDVVVLLRLALVSAVSFLLMTTTRGVVAATTTTFTVESSVVAPERQDHDQYHHSTTRVQGVCGDDRDADENNVETDEEIYRGLSVAVASARGDDPS